MNATLITPAAILAAQRRIADIVQTTPLEYSRPLSALTGAGVWLKLELAQVTGSFKVRGAANALRQLPAGARVIACSAGNHALGVAHAAAITGHMATLVVPETASPAKIAALRRYPVEVILHGAGYDAAEAEAQRLARAHCWHFVSPYNDPAVIAGQGTVAAEVWQALPSASVVLVAVGGGGLASGVGIWVKAMSPRARVIGVQAAASPAMAMALRAGQIVPAPDLPTLADGLAGGLDPTTITFPILQQTLDDLILVEEAAIARAMRWLIDEHHVIAEGSAAVPVAALLEGQLGDLTGQQVVALLCGRNVASATLRQIMTIPPKD